MSKDDSDLGRAIAACKGSAETVTLTKAGAQALVAEIESIRTTVGVEQIDWALFWQAEEDINLFIARRYPGCQEAERRNLVIRLYASYVEYAKLPQEQQR